MNLYKYFFSWYTGAVWSNILASIIWAIMVGTPAFFWGRSKATKHIKLLHGRLDTQDERMASLHAKHDKLHEHLKRQDEQYAAKRQ